MSASTLPYTAPRAATHQPPRAAAPRPGFWRAPFSSVTYREIGHTLLGLPLAITGFVFVVTLFTLGVSLAWTVVGLPVLAALLIAARGLGAVERGRARALLALDVAAPAPRPAARRDGWWPGMLARLSDNGGWKAVAYQAVMFPWRIASFSLSLTTLLTGWTLALYPAYHWVFPTYVDWPGYQVYDYTSGGTHHEYYLESAPQIAGASLLGLVVVFLTPQIVRALTNVDRAAIRGLLS